MKYYQEIDDTVKRDELLGGVEQAIRMVNVNVDSGTAIARGTLLAGNDFEGKFKPAGAEDVEKVLVIVACGSEETDTVITCYTSGVFFREMLIVDDAINLSDFENSLRKQNILLTSIIE